MRPTSLPIYRPWLVRGFLRYSRGMIRRKFHTVAVDRCQLGEIGDRPLIVAANHPSWWDPLIAALLCETVFPDRKMYAPIDANALAKYRILGQMGFYGLELHSRTGAEQFLTISKAILATPGTSIWLTPEGRFSDPRDRSAEMMPGLAHLASKVPGLMVVPLALEYLFWEEPQPEVLGRFGSPLSSEGASWSKEEWNRRFTDSLRQTQDQLADQVIRRDTSPFEVLLSAREKSQSWYDFFRSWNARLRGKPIELRHGDKFTEKRDQHS